MALHYQTEYRLGSRGRICRSYTGFQALVAILFDLIFGLFFELLSMAIALAVRLVVLGIQLVVQLLRINWRILVAGMTLIVYVLTLPFALLHEAVNRFRSRIDSGPIDRESPSASALKPDWALSREV